MGIHIIERLPQLCVIKSTELVGSGNVIILNEDNSSYTICAGLYLVSPNLSPSPHTQLPSVKSQSLWLELERYCYTSTALQYDFK
jgi:hypothetical protein